MESEEVNAVLNAPEEAKQELIKFKYGFFPKSIWYLKKDSGLNTFCVDGIGANSYTEAKPLSEFNPSVAERIIKFWSKTGDKILDPFAGRTRLLVANNLGREYTGFEISKKVYEYLMDKIAKQNKLFDTKVPFILHNKDSRLIEFNSEFDLVFSCP